MYRIGQKITKWRLSQKLSQKKLAELSLVPRPNLSAIEKGKKDCTMSTWIKISRALQIKPGLLLDQNPFEDIHLDREEVDDLVRAALGLKEPSSNRIKNLLPFVIPHLSFIARSAGLKYQLSQVLQPVILPKELFNLIVKRANKIAASYAKGE